MTANDDMLRVHQEMLDCMDAGTYQGNGDGILVPHKQLADWFNTIKEHWAWPDETSLKVEKLAEKLADELSVEDFMKLFVLMAEKINKVAGGSGKLDG